MTQLMIDPDEIADRVEIALKRQKKIMRIALTLVSIGLFILFNVIAWSIATGTGPAVDELANPQGQAVGGMTMLTAGWFITVLYHVILMIMDIPSVEKRTRARLTSRIMGEMVQESISGGILKRKRRESDDIGASLSDDEAMTLGDDGELISERESKRQTRP